jgi:peptidoglycan LD-endopeptidase LytH
MPSSLAERLNNYNNFASVIDPETIKSACLMDFTAFNKLWDTIDLANTEQFNQHIFQHIKENNAHCGAGGYGEERIIYKRSLNFDGVEPRSIHLGIDVWAPAFYSIYSPLEGVVHSFADNEGFGNYGPTIILKHSFGDVEFYTLYGHLSRKSLKDLKEGQSIRKGEKIAELGPYPENGDWPPHLHFQIIEDMQGWIGDYPGVAAPSQKDFYLINCPNPNLILNIPCLQQVKVRI